MFACTTERTRARTHARIYATSTHRTGVYRNKLPFKRTAEYTLRIGCRCAPYQPLKDGVAVPTSRCRVHSKHWFTTSFLKPLPYLVTPKGPENCRLTSRCLLVVRGLHSARAFGHGPVYIGPCLRVWRRVGTLLLGVQ